MPNTDYVSSKYDFKKTVRNFLLEIEIAIGKEKKFALSKKLFEYLIIDDYWLVDNEFKNFLSCVKSKLKELSRENPFGKEYYHGVEERLNFARYCRATTLHNFPCSNVVKKNSNLCHVHKIKYDSILNTVSDFISVKDLAKIITDKCV